MRRKRGVKSGCHGGYSWLKKRLEGKICGYKTVGGLTSRPFTPPLICQRRHESERHRASDAANVSRHSTLKPPPPPPAQTHPPNTNTVPPPTYSFPQNHT